VSCQAGLTNCGGLCDNLQTDPQNCGVCGKTCAAGSVCSSGACALSCQAGLTNCAGVCDNLQTDGQNCGVCGKVCAAPTSACVNGACQ
jgi:hypothetical protein